tara:strand:- start:2212 stop:3063 length:852 start_codon:yes stop_codon:yes gene_type:complete
MPDITKGKTFSSGDTVTAADLNSLLDDAVINNNAVTDAKLADSACTTAKIPDDNVTYAKIQNVATANRVLGSTSADGVISEIQVATDMIADNAVTAAKLAVGAALPTGSITQYAGLSAPDGWLLANGDATLNTFTYKDLHAIISNTYGGTAYSAGVTDQDGVSTTFTLPDLRGRIPVGVGQQTSGKWDSAEEDYSGSGTNFALAATGGTEDHKLLEAEIPSHDHGMPTGTNDIRTTTNTLGGNNDHANSGGGNVGKDTFEAFGGTSSHNNLQPYIALNYIIKT